jgi:hypothetical protein
MVDMIYAQKNLVLTPDKKKQFGRARCRWEDIIKIGNNE